MAAFDSPCSVQRSNGRKNLYEQVFSFAVRIHFSNSSYSFPSGEPRCRTRVGGQRKREKKDRVDRRKRERTQSIRTHMKFAGGRREKTFVTVLFEEAHGRCCQPWGFMKLQAQLCRFHFEHLLSFHLNREIFAIFTRY